MAVLFVLHLPCDDQGDDNDDDAPGDGQPRLDEERDQTADKREGGGGEPGVSAVVSGFTGADGDGIRAAKSSLSGSRSVATVVSFRPQGVEGGGKEQRPLLLMASSVSDPYTKKTFPGVQTVTASQKSPLSGGGGGGGRGSDDDFSVGKFTVSKVLTLPDGCDGVGPNGGRQLQGSPNEADGGSSCRVEVEQSLQQDISTEVITLREALFEVLDALSIENDVWQKNFDEDCWQVKFVIEMKKCDEVLNRLTALGIGQIDGTSVSVFPASFHYSRKCEAEESEERDKEEKRKKSEFLKSIKSRLTIAQVVGTVQSNSSLTFDFLVLIILASMIAGLGLAENSSVVLVASMLISPLMGPIIGFTFGIVVRNPELWKLGVTNELIGLSICLSFGFLFGLLTGRINNTAALWGSSNTWPTMEMQARGMLRSLWVGVLIALPSGAGVALSILGGNTGSLVGVAISASLLPPAVNAGMLWGLALVSAISHPLRNSTVSNATYSQIHPDCCPLLNNGYKFHYSCNMQTEAAILASISLLLTVLNIFCIFLMGIVVLKIKEIAPLQVMSPGTAAFWKRDLPFARGAYRTVKGRRGLDMARMAREVIAEYKAGNPDGNVGNVIEEIQCDPTFYDDHDILPGKVMPQFLSRLSHEGHAFNRVRAKSMVEMVQVGDRCYYTIANSSMTRKFLEAAPSFRNTILERGIPKERSRKGTLVRISFSAEDPSECPASHSSFAAPPNVVMVDARRRSSGGRKMGRRERYTSQMSVPN